MHRQPAPCALATSSGVSPTATVRFPGQLPARSRARSKSSIRFSRSQPNAPCPRGKKLGQPEPFHARVRDRGRVAGQQRAVLDGGRRLGGMRAELPVARVGGSQETNIVRGERLAPAGKTSVYLRFGNVHGAKGAADVCRRSVAWDVRAFGVDPEHGFERQPARLHVHLVMRQKQRPVDVEQHEPGQAATTASTASRNVRTYCCNASAPSSATSTGRDPTTMPSASSAAARACSGVEIPKPA
jgi:hypothetical protein